MSFYFSICKLELILLWHLKRLFWEKSHKNNREFSYWSTDYHLNYVFFLITSYRVETLAVYFPSVKAMPSSNSDFCPEDNSGRNASSLYIQQVRDEETLTYLSILINAVYTCSFTVPGMTQLQVTQPQQDNNCAQRKPSKASKRNLLWDERENYYRNQLLREKESYFSLGRFPVLKESGGRRREGKMIRSHTFDWLFTSNKNSPSLFPLSCSCWLHHTHCAFPHGWAVLLPSFLPLIS